jgi:imidazolonepropionase-like amidohydrolase
LSVTGHVPQSATLAQAIELGMDQVVHLWLDGDPSSAANRDAIAMLAAKHIVVEPTLPWNELFGRAPTTPIESFEPEFSNAPPAMILSYRSVRNATDEAGATAERRSNGAKVKAMFDAGVPIVAGTDGAVPGVSLLRALELYVAAGLTPMQAIQTATSVAARSLGLEDDVGTIAPGRRADLIVLDADPLANISNIRKLHWVVAAGRVFEAATIRRD